MNKSKFSKSRKMKCDNWKFKCERVVFFELKKIKIKVYFHHKNQQQSCWTALLRDFGGFAREVIVTLTLNFWKLIFEQYKKITLLIIFMDSSSYWLKMRVIFFNSFDICSQRISQHLTEKKLLWKFNCFSDWKLHFTNILRLSSFKLQLSKSNEFLHKVIC